MGKTERTSSTKKLANQTCERQLMASMMSGTLNTANRDLAAQSQHTWFFYDFCLSVVPSLFVRLICRDKPI